MKTDKELGRKVHEYLISNRVETPFTQSKLSKQERIELIQDNMEVVIDVLGLDREDDSISGTANRVAKMYVDEIFSGLRYDTFPKCTTVENKFTIGEEFVLEKNITMYSDCEHHLRPIIGHAHIAYIPGKKVLGLSKLNRVTQYFAQRPQVQERLTQQIAHAIAFITDSQNVMVVVDAGHTCVSQRGIKDTQSTTVTATCLGVFGEPGGSLRKEVMANINR